MIGRQAIVEAFHTQTVACQKIGSPFTATICRVIGERLDAATAIGEYILSWRGDPSALADSVPLRLCGALHALVRAETEIPLASIYPPNELPEDEDRVWQLLVDALTRRHDFIHERLQSPPQTNEVARSSVVYCGLSLLSQRYGLPIVLSELGSSAGLNLIADRYRYELDRSVRGNPDSGVFLQPQWRGAGAPAAEPVIAERRGCDRNPLDVHDAQAMARLLSYIWPDQPHRLERTQAAIAMAREFSPSSLVDRRDAAEWLDTRLQSVEAGKLHVVFHTIAWQYFPKPVQDRCLDLLVEAGQRSTDSSPLAWFSLEAAGAKGARISLRTWPDGLQADLGLADYHARWIDWRDIEISAPP